MHGEIQQLVQELGFCGNALYIFDIFFLFPPVTFDLTFYGTVFPVSTVFLLPKHEGPFPEL